MFCSSCGNKLNDNSKFCTNCGNKVQENKVDIKTNKSMIKCPKCGSTNITVQTITENKQTGCADALLLIILAITIIGIPIIILWLLIRGKKSKTGTIKICQNCGKTFGKTI